MAADTDAVLRSDSNTLQTLAASCSIVDSLTYPLSDDMAPSFKCF